MGMGLTNLPNVIYQHEIGLIAPIVTHCFLSQMSIIKTLDNPVEWSLITIKQWINTLVSWPFVSCSFPKTKRGLWNCFCPFVHSFVHRSVCSSGQNSATSRPIHSKLCSLKLSWPVDVQLHAQLPVGSLEPSSQGGGPSSDLLLFIERTKKLKGIEHCAYELLYTDIFCWFFTLIFWLSVVI